MARTLGAPLRPQALFLGFEPDDPGLLAMRGMVARAELIQGTYDLEMRFRMREWDMLVTRGQDDGEWSFDDVPSWVHVLALGPSSTGWLERRSGDGAIAMSYSGQQPSTLLQVHDEDVPSEMSRLVMTELIPWLDALERRPFLRADRSHGYDDRYRDKAAEVPAGSPLVTDADGNFVAGVLNRNDGSTAGGAAVVLPFVPDAPERWLSASIELWRALTPSRFEDLPGWQSSVKWQTTEEMAAHAGVAEVREGWTKAERAFRAAERAAESKVAAAVLAADNGRRRLLTGTDAALVSGVVEAMSRLGFLVSDMDELSADGAAKMEDLQLSDPDDPSWSNITEVKGYTRGAKTRDFQAIARFAAAYLRREGELPRSRWYVVNHFRENDPDARPRLLAGAEEDVAGFAEDGGLVIDTRDLFVLVRRVEDGELSESDARATLRGRTGLFTLEATP